jgi:transcription-repair coupling factor (superfamily II helicase)
VVSVTAVDAPLGPVLEAVRTHEDVAHWLEAHRTNGTADARVSDPILPVLLAAAAAGQNAGGILAVVASDADAERIAEAAQWYLGDEHAAAYISRGVPYGAGIAPAPARVGAREEARQVAARGGLVVASIPALLEKVPAGDARPECVSVAVGDTIERERLMRALVDAGYERSEQADERGQFAARGDIVDVYGTTAKYPVRIDFFDDEVESIRQFSAYTQRSLGPLNAVRLQPAVEAVGLGHAGAWHSDEGMGDLVLEAASGLEPAWQVLVSDDLRPMVVESAAVQREATEELVELDAAHVERPGYVSEEDITALLGRGVRLDTLQANQRFSFIAEPPVFAALGFAEAEAELRGLASRGLRAVITFPHEGHLGRTQRQLKRVDTEKLGPNGLDGESGVWLTVSLAASGFVSPQLGLAVVPSGRLFRTRVTGEKTAAGKVGQAMAAFTSLRVGDYVVHEDHGVGRFAGFETKTVAGVTRDYLYLEFAGADRLYVPHEQIGKVTRYVGADGSAPSLSKLGGKRWSNLKNRVRVAVRELAGELLALYAKRARAVGHAFPPDDELMQKFELSFPHQETDDQLVAIGAVKEDMERPHPMDRLICGDVGFGKTEVAMRAAMKAVSGGRQVMVLVPTTVLAQQHLVSFRERFDGQAIEVDMVSRFRTPKAVKETLKRFAEGKVDILIGTHRLLSRDVMPKNLGLVVVDEEQRFGVAQKELLRQLRLEVDVLALSATPIPRTLHMSLAGIRDITVIETPPMGRRPIHTHVGEYDEELVRMAVERELERDGQVFYLHNRVETIDEAAAKVAQVCPKARVGIGHGQMGERELEKVMLGFLRRDFDVLVATTIIESGLDIPSANTLIVDRADRLGLAQLYQIRGRVGRSTRSAHAYLFYPDRRELTEEARARLTTLSDFTDLGSGSKIAMRDLELRGAGNLLGGEQSGHVAAIGFELYVEMLAESVAELSGEEIVEERTPQIDTRMHAYVPADYVASEAIKIDLHRRIALARDEHRLEELEAELDDRFGEVPEPVQNLIALARMRMLLNRIGADRLSITQTKVAAQPVRLSDTQLSYLRSDLPWVVYGMANRELACRLPSPEEGPKKALEMLRATAKVMGV